MANRNHLFFLTALLLTILIHLLAVSPLSKWLNREILPALSDESLVIDLSEIKAQKDSSVDQTISGNQTPEKSKPAPDKKPKPTEKQLPIPQTKKHLDPTLTEDKIVSKEQVPPKQTSPAKPAKTARKETDTSQSPLFIRKPKADTPPEQKKKKVIPEEVKKTFRDGKPEKTDDEKLEYSMNSYKWTFKRYMGNWALDIQKWWKAPLDYAMGNVPEGGNMWIEVKIGKSGRLQGYRIKSSDVTAEMELRVIQALIGSFARPPLPESFPKESLLINWHFIYPPVRPQLRIRR